LTLAAEMVYEAHTERPLLMGRATLFAR
jgi:hypothetical protein